jgi:hypothetical protein
MAWVAERLDCAEPLRRLALTAPEDYVWRAAVLAVLDTDYDRAAGILVGLGHVDEAYANLRAGETCIAGRRPADASTRLRDAISSFRRLGATSYIRRAEELLAGEGLEVPA